MLKIGITGGSGFLGSLLSKRLREDGINDIKIIDVVGDPLFNSKVLSEFVTGVDVVYHLAGIKDSKNPDLERVNVQGTKNLLEMIRKFAPNSHFVFASSFAVYKIPESGEIISENFATVPRNEYGKSKLEAEKYIQEYSSKFNIKSTILRMSNVYGPGDSFGRNSVVSDFIDKIRKGEAICIDGDGSQTRDFIFVDDVVSALIKVKSDPNHFNILNIASGEEISISKLVSVVEKIVNKKAIVKFNPVGSQGGFWKGDPRLAMKLLSWSPSISLEDGVRRIIMTKI